MSKNYSTSAVLRSVTKPSANGVLNSDRCSRKNCATVNSAGVHGGISTRSARAWTASGIGCSWPERTPMRTPGRWRAVDEHGFVLDILLQRHRDTEAAKTFLTRLLGEYDVPEVIQTDQLRSYQAAIRGLPSLDGVDHQQVISTARCNNSVEQSHRPTRRQDRQQAGFKRRKRAQEFLHLHARIENLHHHSRTSVSAATRKSNQQQAFQTWSTVAAGVA